jgi:hypothetical protein
MISVITDVFLFKLLLSFVVGGCYIAAMLWVSERFGSKIGGILIGLPLTTLISLIFIAWTQGEQAATAAVPVIPATIAANSILLVMFIHQYQYGRIIAYGSALVLWLLLTLPLVIFHVQSILASLLLAALFFTVAIYFLRRFPYRKIPKYTFSRAEFMFRVCFVGTVVACAVLLGKVLGPLWGGLFASFPAAISSSLILLERKHGIDFTASVARTMPYGSMGNILFVLVFFYIDPFVGIGPSILLGYISALAFAFVINTYVLSNK